DSLVAFVRMGLHIQYPGCGYFVQSLRKGTNVGLKAIQGRGQTLYQRMAGHPKLEEIFHQGMTRFTAQTNAILSRAPGLSKRRCLLDIGGADGTNVILLHRNIPSLKAIVFDVRSVCARTEKRLRRMGLSHAIKTHAGDVFKDDLPTEIDGVLLSH